MDPLGFHKGRGQGQRPFLVAKTSLQGLGKSALRQQPQSHPHWGPAGGPEACGRGGGFSEQGCMLIPMRLQAVSGAQSVGPRPAIGRLLRWDSAGRLGTVGPVRKGSRHVLCSTPACIEPHRTSELASLGPVPSWALVRSAGHPPALKDDLPERCSKTGDCHLLSTGRRREESPHCAPSPQCPVPAFSGCSVCACLMQKNRKWFYLFPHVFLFGDPGSI